jgi:CubicO group peptidase (beta-lactamase class C family)
VTRFLDSLIPRQLDSLRSPGGVVAVTIGDSAVLVRGYGHADLARTVPVDPARHLFRIASITKTVTATAIMQLVERGQLDLDADVNGYLRAFQVPTGYGRPITARTLLWHVSGIDDDYDGIAIRDPALHRPLGEVFAERGVNRVREPGRVIVYTNRAYMLLGHLIEARSGRQYEQYIQTELLGPLGMTRSTFIIDDANRADLMVGTTRTSTGVAVTLIPDTYTRPSGDLLATARDMTRYLIAHLNGGRIGDRRILGDSTTLRMYRDCFRHHPSFGGWCLGWRYRKRNGLDIFQHGGDHPGYQSQLLLIPAKQFGLFLSYSSSDGSLSGRLANLVVDRFFPGPTPEVAPAPTAATPISDLAGTYRVVASNQSFATFEKLGVLLRGSEARLADSAGVVTFAGRRLVEEQPLLFRDVGSGQRMVFIRGDNGRVRWAAGNDSGLERLRWWEVNRIQRAVVIGATVALGLGLLGFLFGGGLPRRRFRDARLAEAILALTAGTWLLTIVGLALTFPRQWEALIYGVSDGFGLFLSLPRVAAALTVVAILAVVPVLGRSTVSPLTRLRFAIVLGASVFLVPWMRYWQFH